MLPGLPAFAYLRNAGWLAREQSEVWTGYAVETATGELRAESMTRILLTHYEHLLRIDSDQSSVVFVTPARESVWDAASGMHFLGWSGGYFVEIEDLRIHEGFVASSSIPWQDEWGDPHGVLLTYSTDRAVPEWSKEDFLAWIDDPETRRELLDEGFLRQLARNVQ